MSKNKDGDANDAGSLHYTLAHGTFMMEKGYLSFEEPCYTLLPAGRDLICELLHDCFTDNKQA